MSNEHNDETTLADRLRATADAPDTPDAPRQDPPAPREEEPASPREPRKPEGWTQRDEADAVAHRLKRDLGIDLNADPEED